MFDWFLALSDEVKMAVVGLGVAVVTVLGAALNAYVNRNPEREEEFKPHPTIVEFAEKDRAVIERLTKTVEEHGEEIGKHREEMMMARAAGTGRRRTT